MRRLLTVAATLFALLFIAGGAQALLDLSARHAFDVRSSHAGVRTITVEDDSGDVRLTGAPAGGPVRVVAHLTEGLRKPRWTATRGAGGTLRLRASCPVLFSTVCDVRFEVEVPAGVAVSAHSGHGSVTAEGVSAPDVELETGAGSVRASGLRVRRVRASAGAGDVRVGMLTPPSLVDAHSGAGGVELTVPDAVYAVDAHAGAGDVIDGAVRKDPASPRRITATSGAGDVRIDVR